MVAGGGRTILPVLPAAAARPDVAKWTVAAIIGIGRAVAARLSPPTRTAPADLAFYLPLTRGWELWLGALLALGVTPRLPRWAREVMALLALAAIGWTVFALPIRAPFPGWIALVPTARRHSCSVTRRAHWSAACWRRRRSCDRPHLLFTLSLALALAVTCKLLAHAATDRARRCGLAGAVGAAFDPQLAVCRAAPQRRRFSSKLGRCWLERRSPSCCRSQLASASSPPAACRNACHPRRPARYLRRRHLAAPKRLPRTRYPDPTGAGLRARRRRLRRALAVWATSATASSAPTRWARSGSATGRSAVEFTSSACSQASVTTHPVAQTARRAALTVLAHILAHPENRHGGFRRSWFERQPRRTGSHPAGPARCV